MTVLAVVQVAAVVCAGLLAGIYLGHRAGAHYALQKIDASSFVRFQQVVHAKFVRFMPALVLTALLSALAWLVMLRSEWNGPEFWLVAASVAGIVLIAALTRAVNIPLNNRLMSWDAAAPPEGLREMWEPWDRVNTIRTVLGVAVVMLEAVALALPG